MRLKQILWLLLLIGLALFLFTSETKSQTGHSVQVATKSQSLQDLQQGAKQLSAVLAEYVAEQKVMGAELLIIHKGQVLVADAYGWMDKEDEKKLKPHTIFNIRSMTKPFTGAAAQLLIDEGKLELQAPISKYLPNFANGPGKDIVVQHLLEHRSGLPMTMFVSSVDEFESLNAVADAAAEAELKFTPGSDFSYSDAGSDVLGAVVAAASGMDLDAFIQSRLLDPLGMKDSFYTLPKNDLRVSRLASLYVGFSGSWLPNWKAKGEVMYPFAWGSQSLYSTPRDYARFLQMWMDGGVVDGGILLSPEAMQRTLTPVSHMMIGDSDKEYPTGFPNLATHYGQMSVLYCEAATATATATATAATDHATSPVRIIGHSGSDGTLAYAWPDRDLILCMFTQSRGMSLVHRFEADIHRFLLAPETNTPPPAELVPLLGYYLPESGPMRGRRVEVVMLHQKLAVDIPGQMVFELSEPDADGWRFMLFDPRSKLKFEQSGTEEATAILFQAPGSTEIERVPRMPDLGEQVAAKLPKEFHRYFGYYWDEEGQAEVKFYEFEGTLTASHPKVPVPLKFSGPDADGFWTMDLNPTVRIRFVEGESGEITSYEVHVQDQIVPRKRLRGLL
jgi:CubicO group peptidase (beta-lactamase class C family)